MKRGCGAACQAAADCQSACLHLAQVRKSGVGNAAQDDILPHRSNAWRTAPGAQKEGSAAKGVRYAFSGEDL